MREPLVQALIRWGLLGALFGAGVAAGSGCLVRAPTSYELDKRAGSGIPPADPDYEHPKRYRRKGGTFEEPLRSTSGIAPAPLMPARTAPVIRRVWVADQTLPDGSWLQGTWWFMEVEPSHWLHEIDPGAAPFAEPELVPAEPAPESRSEHKVKRGKGAERERDDGRRRHAPEPTPEPDPEHWFGPFQVED